MQKQFIKDNLVITQFLNKLKAAELQYPTLSKEQEQELIERYKDDEMKWRDLLVMHNLRLVFSNAKKYAFKTGSFDDMCQRGLFGLVTASRRFDPSLGYKFTTYANTWIFKYIVDEFYSKQINIDNNSISMDKLYTPSNSKSNDSAQTFSNYVEDFMEPTYVPPSVKPLPDILSGNDETMIIDTIAKFIDSSDSIHSDDKQIFKRFFFNREKVKEISASMNLPINVVIEKKNNAVSHVKSWLGSEYGIHSMDDILV